jgi:antitoxin (DNA-binding transcriptional repressor) of toxin-antitoxin stability system
MAVTHISEAEAKASTVTGLLERVCAGEEIMIDTATFPVSIRIAPFERRTISQSIAIAEASAKKLGYEPVMDEDFATDMREIIARRKPRDHSAWD